MIPFYFWPSPFFILVKKKEKKTKIIIKKNQQLEHRLNTQLEHKVFKLSSSKCSSFVFKLLNS